MPPSRDHSCTLLCLLACFAASCSGLEENPGQGEHARTEERIELEQATKLVSDLIASRRGSSGADTDVSLEELGTEEMWEVLGVQLYKVISGLDLWNSFVVHDGRAHFLATGFGGHGIQSACVSDLDGDGEAELTYTYSFGSGVHRSHVAVFRFAVDGPVQEEVPMAFVGDLFVRGTARGGVAVEIGQYTFRGLGFEVEAPMGEVRVDPSGGMLRPHIDLSDLAESYREFVWPDPDQSGG